MHVGPEVEQVSHYHGPGQILKGAIGSGKAGQVRVETSQRVRSVCGHGWRLDELKVER